jgi:hypothetical protein
LIDYKEEVNTHETWIEINGLFKPVLTMERPLFSPPIKVAFEKTAIEDGQAGADTDVLFEQFYVDIEELRNNVKSLLRNKSQVALSELLSHYHPTKGITEILGYIQLATNDEKHVVNREVQEELIVENQESGKTYRLQAPLIIFNR